MIRPNTPGFLRHSLLDCIPPPEAQGRCSCDNCIAGIISPRMKWLLLSKCDCTRGIKINEETGFASIFEACLPRSLCVFEDYGKDRIKDEDFLDLDVYGDLDHMPLALRRCIKEDIRVMSGYCEVFSKIIECLKDGRAPTPSLVDKRIRYSWRDRDSKYFLDAGGKSQYALYYLIATLKSFMLHRGGLRYIDSGLQSEPRCLNDTNFELVAELLVREN